MTYKEGSLQAQIELGYRLLKLKIQPKSSKLKITVGNLNSTKTESIELYSENVKALRDYLSQIIIDNDW